MQLSRNTSAFILGIFLFFGLSALGYLLANAAIKIKEYERTVVVKGLSEREYDADIVIWPIKFTLSGNNLENLYREIENNTLKTKSFLVKRGIPAEDISFASPQIIDKFAQQYSGDKPEFRYTGFQTLTVYSKNIKAVRSVMGSLSELGKQGIIFTADDYNSRTEYIFNRLNEIKPVMIEEATKNAREVAEKFASDSKSKLGKIKRASQGQFSIRARDTNNPHIKKVRVVSTVEYYLSD